MGASCSEMYERRVVAPKWGRPLTGEQMLWARLPTGDLSFREDLSGGYIRLPADHIAYKVLDHNEKHGTSFVPHYGGDSAPDDYDSTKEVLFANGDTACNGNGFKWQHSMGGGNIIAYNRKVGAVIDFSDDGPIPNTKITLDSDGRITGFECVSQQSETITITKMTEAEARKQWGTLVNSDSFISELHALGLIKPEPTREERFWAQFGDATNVNGVVKGLVKEALEFER